MRRLYTLIVLRGTETTETRATVWAADVIQAFARVREVGYTPIAVWEIK